MQNSIIVLFETTLKNIVKKIQAIVHKKPLPKSATPSTRNAGPSSVALAKSQYASGQQATAIRTIEAVLFQNPDHTDGLQWWITLYQKRLEAKGTSKEKAYYLILQEANKRFNSITVKSLLTQFCHKHGKKDLALGWYHQALLLADATDPRLIETTSLLKNASWLDAADVSAPASTPSPSTSYDKQPDNTPAAALEWWGIDQPLWCYGWEENPTGIEPPQSESRIILFQFTGKSTMTTTNQVWVPEDLLGQISRAIPLYLLEDIYYHSSHSASVIFPVTALGKFGFLSEKLSKDTIIAVLGDRYPAAITGHFTGEKLELTHLNLQTQEETTRVITLQASRMGRALSEIEQFLCETCDIDREERSEYAALGFSDIPLDTIESYLSALAQHVALVNACYYPASAKALQKPHRIIRHFLDLAFSAPTLQTQLILLSSIQQNMMFHSEAIKDYQEPLLAWLSEEAVNPGPLHGLASATWEKFAAYCGGS